MFAHYRSVHRLSPVIPPLLGSRVSGEGPGSFKSLASSFQREDGLGTEPSLSPVCLREGEKWLPAFLVLTPPQRGIMLIPVLVEEKEDSGMSPR